MPWGFCILAPGEQLWRSSMPHVLPIPLNWEGKSDNGQKSWSNAPWDWHLWFWDQELLDINQWLLKNTGEKRPKIYFFYHQLGTPKILRLVVFLLSKLVVETASWYFGLCGSDWNLKVWRCKINFPFFPLFCPSCSPVLGCMVWIPLQ